MHGACWQVHPIFPLNSCQTDLYVCFFKGDIPMAEKFERFNQHSRRDLDSLRSALKSGAAVPRFHYETRAFSVVK